MDISQLENKTKEELLDIVKEMELPDCATWKNRSWCGGCCKRMPNNRAIFSPAVSWK